VLVDRDSRERFGGLGAGRSGWLVGTLEQRRMKIADCPSSRWTGCFGELAPDDAWPRAPGRNVTSSRAGLTG
jgi:hypothetical protein